ncbi:hypothetical protein ACFQ64_37735 [Streptomyces sp. NPDC056460]|uniref:hypothetical protein n=1 Tax=Streptomyces sp. NPDC056460 TaxID=3345825 RepID=UPI0036C20C38
MRQRTKEELLEEYPDPEVRENILRLIMLSDILGACLITKDYKPRTHLNNQIKLTPYGNDIVQAFARKRIPIPEARVICFLELSWLDLLVDPIATDIKKVQEAISQQIREGAIRFPFIFGRELYDRAHLEIDPDERSLENSATFELIKDSPQGVFQMHEYVTGPFGLLSSKELRFFPPKQGANLLHCSDTNCHRIHWVNLSTATEAPVNKHRREATRVLRKESEAPSAWGSFIEKVFSDAVKPARDHASEPLVPLIGDCLTDGEIKDLTIWLLDNTKGSLRNTCMTVGLTGGAREITRDLNRAELMQLCLTVSDRDLIQGIDTLVHQETIKVPDTEIRIPPINGDSTFGIFGITAEIGRHGVRISSERMHLAPLRLRSLIEQMYRLSDVADREELEWQLREVTGETLEARLENYLSSQPPRSAVESLVLARKSNAVAACEILGLRDGASESPDFIPLVLWKLGFASNASGDPHAKFWRYHEQMENMARRGPGGPLSPSIEDFRGGAANYFVELESILDDAAAFAIWALTHDHMTDRKPFTFEPDRQRSVAYEWLQSAVRRKGDNELTYGERNSLYGLCRSFQCLSSELQTLATDRERYRRPESDFPDWAAQQSLQRYPFRHTIPFLDLTDDSQASVVKQLAEISRVLVSEKIYDARNNWLHGGKKDLDFSLVKAELSAVRNAVQLLEDSGFARVSFAQSSQRTDGWGRRVTTLANPRGVTLEMHSPNPFSWLSLPAIGGEVHVMTAACFADPNNFLRFSSESTSPYTEMWMDYPKRKPRSQRVGQALEGVRGTPRERAILSGTEGSELS